MATELTQCLLQALLHYNPETGTFTNKVTRSSAAIAGDVSHSINSQNLQSARCDNKTGLLGASYDKQRGKFLSQIFVDGKKKNLGRFATAIEAHSAHITAKRQLHQGNTL